jgi:signal peptidase I
VSASTPTTWLPPAPALPPASRRNRAWLGVGIAAALGLIAALATAAIVLHPRWIRVEGHSMSPTLQNGDRAIFVRLRQPPGRGSVVALRYPKDPTKSFVMRIVGLPGEQLSIDDGVVSIDGRPLAEPYLLQDNRSHERFAPRQLGPDEYFVLGDNRRNASDSREWGPVPGRHIWATLHAVVVRPGPVRR